MSSLSIAWVSSSGFPGTGCQSTQRSIWWLVAAPIPQGSGKRGLKFYLLASFAYHFEALSSIYSLLVPAQFFHFWSFVSNLTIQKLRLHICFFWSIAFTFFLKQCLFSEAVPSYFWECSVKQSFDLKCFFCTSILGSFVFHISLILHPSIFLQFKFIHVSEARFTSCSLAPGRYPFTSSAWCVRRGRWYHSTSRALVLSGYCSHNLRSLLQWPIWNKIVLFWIVPGPRYTLFGASSSLQKFFSVGCMLLDLNKLSGLSAVLGFLD